MPRFNNKIMLITYPNCMGNNLKDLKYVLDTYIKDAIGGVHILPFFPSSADRGFSPKTYMKVDNNFGCWDDIEKIAKDYYMMYDYMINHISAQSEYYKDFLENKDRSKYNDLFIRYDKFWNNLGPTKEDLDLIYRRNKRPPYVYAKFKDGTKEKVWCTFDSEQIDINVNSRQGKVFTKQNLEFLASHGASIIRLDAFAYAIKKQGSNCFFVEPYIWDLLFESSKILQRYNVYVLPEVHEHYSIQKKISNKGFWVYDFALPMLLLNAIYYSQSKYLREWFKICPKKQFTTLDTHDGIGVVDVKDLIPDFEIDRTKQHLYSCGANVKKVYNTAEYNNVDVYQINCTYYSALGNNNNDYLLSRAVQFFAPGVPQVYYVGMLAGSNDIDLLERTKVGRNINRHYYTLKEVKQETNREVVKSLIRLMRFRNNHPAFNGEFCLCDSKDDELIILRKNQKDYAKLFVNFLDKSFKIIYTKDENEYELKI